MSRRPHFVTFGPAIDVVPVGDFSRLPGGLLADAWSIVGPSAEKNMQRDRLGRCLEQWQVIAAAYLEGLQHGAALARQADQAPPAPASDPTGVVWA